MSFAEFRDRKRQRAKLREQLNNIVGLLSERALAPFVGQLVGDSEDCTSLADCTDWLVVWVMTSIASGNRDRVVQQLLSALVNVGVNTQVAMLATRDVTPVVRAVAATRRRAAAAVLGPLLLFGGVGFVVALVVRRRRGVVHALR